MDDDNDGISDKIEQGCVDTGNPLYKDYRSGTWTGKDALSGVNYLASIGTYVQGYKDDGNETFSFTVTDLTPGVVNTLKYRYYSLNPQNPDANSVTLSVNNSVLHSFNTVSGQPQGSTLSIDHGTKTVSFTPTSTTATVKISWTTAVNTLKGSDAQFREFQVNGETIIECTDLDTDGDGIPNYQDLDSDNDGISDAVEANPANATNVGSNCRLPDGDNIVNGCEDGSTDFAITTVQSSDADNQPDYLDLDSDGDGCSDAVEAGTSSYTVNTTEYTLTADQVNADGRTNAPCSAPANTNWTNASVKSSACGALPVTFDDVSAFIQGGMLKVNWATVTEQECDHFEIEVSEDGKNWKKASDNIISKAAGGNSDINIQYEQSIPLSGMAVMGISVFLLSMGMMLRRNKWLGSVLMIVGISAVLYGCAKNDNDIVTLAEKVYVRIKQVDKDGTASYSKVMTVVVK